MRVVWEQCDGKNSLTNILDNLQMKNGRHLTIGYVQLALKRLTDEGLLNAGADNSILNGISRRSVIKKIGAGGLVALPIIASIAIPTPAEAASCFGLGHLCHSGSQCCSGHCGIAGVSLVCLP
jgi:hypothetical protein